MKIHPFALLVPFVFSPFINACNLVDDLKDDQDELCPEWEGKSEADVQELVDESLAEQADAGNTSDVWQDEAAFAALVARIYRKAGCPLPSDLDLGENGDATNYCGPGKGGHLPTVDDCINRKCSVHDACYDQCSEPLDKACYFSSATASCDDRFVMEMEACDISDHRFASLIALSVGRSLNDDERSGCPDTECPEFADVDGGQ